MWWEWPQICYILWHNNKSSDCQCKQTLNSLALIKYVCKCKWMLIGGASSMCARACANDHSIAEHVRKFNRRFCPTPRPCMRCLNAGVPKTQLSKVTHADSLHCPRKSVTLISVFWSDHPTRMGREPKWILWWWR
jgi:hypothetical protein